MAISNFWLEARIDGQKQIREGGPRSRDGGMKVVIKTRLNSKIVTAFTIECEANQEGDLLIQVHDRGGELVAEDRSTR